MEDAEKVCCRIQNMEDAEKAHCRIQNMEDAGEAYCRIKYLKDAENSHCRIQNMEDAEKAHCRIQNMEDAGKAYCRILSVLRNLRSLHHLSESPIIEYPPEIKLLTETAFMHSVATRLMWQNCFRKLPQEMTSLKYYLDFYVHACDSIHKSATNVFEHLLSILALTANIEVFFHNRGLEYMEYSEGIVETIFKRDIYKCFNYSGGIIGFKNYISSSGYPKRLYGTVEVSKGKFVVKETAFRNYCKKLEPLIPKLKIAIGRNGYTQFPQLTFFSCRK